ncbi:caspase family protein [Flavitalea flava]
MKLLILIVPHFLIIMALGQKSEHHLPVFHAFLFANTNDVAIGVACREDLSNITRQVGVICTATGYRLDQQTFDGFNFDTSNINKVLQNSTINDSDVIFLYFCSHGGRTKADTGDFPNILFPGRDQYVSSENIHTRFKNKFHPKLLVTFINACDSLMPVEQSQIVYFKEAYKHEFPKTLRMNQVNFYKKLWKYSNGDIIMTSSQKGATSLGTSDGSIFTNEFIRVSEQFSNMHGGMEVTPTTWNNFFNYLQRSTKAKAAWTSYTYWHDTTSRFPVWKNSTTSPDKYNFDDDGYPEVHIYIDHIISETDKGSVMGNIGFKKLSIGVTSINGFPDLLAPKVKAVTFYIKDPENNSETIIQGSKENAFKVTYQSKKEILVYAVVKFLDGQESDIVTIE